MGFFERHSDDLRLKRADYFANPSVNLTRYCRPCKPGLSQALLTAALHHHAVDHDPVAASRYLDEAQRIAERGPMPLYLADVHLHRARLFRDKAELEKARALIQKHEYGLRREELADADEAARFW